MHVTVRTLVLLLSAGLLAGTVQAAPRSIADCAAITNAFSYNACLASFGPMQRGGVVRREPSSAAGPAPKSAAPRAPAGRFGTFAHGRYHAVFYVGGGQAASSPYRHRFYRHRRR